MKSSINKMKCLYLFVIILKLTSAIPFQTAPALAIDCHGTDDGLSKPSDQHQHYEQLRERYTNCTHVNGNLEITWLQDKDFDLSFLKSIREVTGYLLVHHVNVPKISLTALEQIHGKTLFKHNYLNDEFGIFVTKNDISFLEMPSLEGVLNGSRGFYDNPHLCNIDSIKWDYGIKLGNASNYVIEDFWDHRWNCPGCDASCTYGSCWGAGPDNCQKFSSTALKAMNDAYAKAIEDNMNFFKNFNISLFFNRNEPIYRQNRCVSPDDQQCCHSDCKEACKGPESTDCVPCKYFDKNGKCIRECIASLSYDAPVSFTSERLKSYKGCEIIYGSIEIYFNSFAYVYPNGSRTDFDSIHPDELEVFSTVKEITGSLSFKGQHQDFKNLSYFRNLEVIRGEPLYKFGSALYLVRTPVESAKLPALKEITNGGVYMGANKNLCDEPFEYWKRVTKVPHMNPKILNNCWTCDHCSAGQDCSGTELKDCSYPMKKITIMIPEGGVPGII